MKTGTDESVKTDSKANGGEDAPPANSGEQPSVPAGGVAGKIPQEAAHGIPQQTGVVHGKDGGQGDGPKKDLASDKQPRPLPESQKATSGEVPGNAPKPDPKKLRNISPDVMPSKDVMAKRRMIREAAENFKKVIEANVKYSPEIGDMLDGIDQMSEFAQQKAV